MILDDFLCFWVYTEILLGLKLAVMYVSSQVKRQMFLELNTTDSIMRARRWLERKGQEENQNSVKNEL